MDGCHKPEELLLPCCCVRLISSIISVSSTGRPSQKIVLLLYRNGALLFLVNDQREALRACFPSLAWPHGRCNLVRRPSHEITGDRACLTLGDPVGIFHVWRAGVGVA